MKRVLVADRDPEFLKTVGGFLREEFDISHARTPNAVLQKAKEEQPDLILLGYFEPRGESFNLHKELREQERTAGISILVIDVPSQDHLRKGWRRIEGLQMDAEGYLSRPLDSETLNCEVKRVMESKSAGMLNWEQILEQTERKLLQEVDRWNGTPRQVSQPGRTNGHKSRRRQPARLGA
jgi:putative two-component system response regulator